MEHTPASFEVPELEKILAKKKKRYVGYEEGMALYSMRKISFRKLAQEAHCSATRFLRNSDRIIEKK